MSFDALIGRGRLAGTWLRLVDVRAIERAAAALPNAALIIIGGGGHKLLREVTTGATPSWRGRTASLRRAFPSRDPARP